MGHDLDFFWMEDNLNIIKIKDNLQKNLRQPLTAGKRNDKKFVVVENTKNLSIHLNFQIALFLNL